MRVGFFTVRAVEKNEELTFDYKFQRFGEAAQQCYCGSANCRGYLGAPKQSENRLLGVEGCFSSPNGRESKRRGRGRGDADSMVRPHPLTHLSLTSSGTVRETGI